ncbi:MAG: potassium-transporting ATPase subunit KdpA [Omnitrophica WOR_2 bacterium]
MNTEILGVILMYIVVLALAVPLGKYISRVFALEPMGADKIFNHLEKLLYRAAGIDQSKAMSWKGNLIALLTINLIWFLISLFVLMNMRWLPLNPDGNPSMNVSLAFNTSVSFITNTNLQHYAGETGVSYLGQLMLLLWQFVSAATGIAICAVAFVAIKEKTTTKTGNFYVFFVRTITRILLPLAFIGGFILIFNGTPMTFDGKIHTTTLEGADQVISTGPVAAFVSIKQLGTNGGGYYGSNSSNPMENPNYLSNILETVFISLIPIAMIFAFGFFTGKKKLATIILGVMTIGFLILAITSITSEMKGNPAIDSLGINQNMGNMEGKEVRFGSAASAYWAVNTTCTSNGSVNSMHDSMTPLTGIAALTAMMVNSFYGGAGVGFLNFYIFIILAVFISGLMVGRTPEFLGKKIESKEVKIAVSIALLHPFFILTGTALASYLFAHNPDKYAVWLNNPSYHGFSEMLYEFTSAAANNGSGFEGLGDNTVFWNISTAIIMLLARYLPIIGPVAIAGILATKSYTPESTGTLNTETTTFGMVIFFVVIIIAALSFFPALALSQFAEYFTLYQ